MKKLLVSVAVLSIVAMGAPSVNANALTNAWSKTTNAVSTATSKVTNAEKKVTDTQTNAQKKAAAKQQAVNNTVDEQTTFWSNQKKFWKKVFTFGKAS